MKLSYLSLSDKPFLLIHIQTKSHRAFYPMMVDTGADYTCFPADLASLIGHDNSRKGIVSEQTCGVGGETQAFVHPTKVSLLDPAAQVGEKKAPTIWESRQDTFRFLESFSCPFGLLGRDVIKEWKKLSISTAGERWRIDILI